MAKVYKSKVDWWLWLALGIPLVGIAAAFYQGLTRDDDGMFWVALIAAAMMTFVYGGLVFPMRYTIEDTGLRVRAGLFLRLFVPWDRYRSAELTRNPLSSPALSLQRIRITYLKPNGKEAWVMISPTDREQFLQDLRQAGSGSTQPEPVPHSQ
jgi:hypothetical protein